MCEHLVNLQLNSKQMYLETKTESSHYPIIDSLHNIFKTDIWGQSF